LFAHAWLVLLGSLFLARLFNRGPYKSANLSSIWVKIIGVISILGVIFGLIALYGDLGELLGA